MFGLQRLTGFARSLSSTSAGFSATNDSGSVRAASGSSVAGKATVVAAAVLGFSMPGLAAEAPLNILFFGNSFSQGGVQWRVQDIAGSDGYAKPNVLLDSMGGQDLKYHIGEVVNYPQNNVNHSLISGKTWDYVVMQENSTIPTHIGDPDAFRANALDLYRKVRDHESGRGVGVKGVLFETWARAPGHYFYGPDYRKAFESPSHMQAELSANYLAAYNDIAAAEGESSIRLATPGQAFEALDFSTSLYGDDLYHPNGAGSMLASLMIYRTIYNEDVSDIPYSVASKWARWSAEGIDEATWNLLTATADATPVIVPEPTSLALVGLASAALLRRRRNGSA